MAVYERLTSHRAGDEAARSSRRRGWVAAVGRGWLTPVVMATPEAGLGADGR
jgi:hypothetical protein